MLNESIEVIVHLYQAKGFNKFTRKLQQENDGDGESTDIDDLVRRTADGSIDENVEPPVYTITRMMIRPADMVTMSEASSLESYFESPDLPVVDSTEIELRSGVVLLVNEKYEDIIQKLKNYYVDHVQ